MLQILTLLFCIEGRLSEKMLALRRCLRFGFLDDLSPIHPLPSAIRSVLTTESIHFKAKKVNDWSNSIISAALKGLQSLNRPYKYAVTVILMQKNGAGLVSSASTFWDASKDGLCKVVWENQTMVSFMASISLLLQVFSVQLTGLVAAIVLCNIALHRHCLWDERECR